jgi:biotin carboxyl carrier protein
VYHIRSGGEAAPRPTESRGELGPLTAPMPGTVRSILVRAGQQVRRGDALIVLEAMKMELPLSSMEDATVAAVRCREGELVAADTVLVEFASAPPATASS